MLLNKKQIKEFLPHRDPFLFVDSIESIETINEIGDNPKDLIGTIVTSHFKITNDLLILSGHFPGNPIMPGVVQIEMMAQSSAFISYPLAQKLGGDIRCETLLLGVDKAKFRKPLVPECSVKMISKMVKCRGHIATYESVLICNDQKIAEASFLAQIIIIKD